MYFSGSMRWAAAGAATPSRARATSAQATARSRADRAEGRACGANLSAGGPPASPIAASPARSEPGGGPRTCPAPGAESAAAGTGAQSGVTTPARTTRARAATLTIRSAAAKKRVERRFIVVPPGRTSRRGESIGSRVVRVEGLDGARAGRLHRDQPEGGAGQKLDGRRAAPRAYARNSAPQRASTRRMISSGMTTGSG